MTMSNRINAVVRFMESDFNRRPTWPPRSVGDAKSAATNGARATDYHTFVSCALAGAVSLTRKAETRQSWQVKTIQNHLQMEGAHVQFCRDPGRGGEKQPLPRQELQ